MDDGSSPEFCLICALVEMTWDDPDRARSVVREVRAEDIADGGCRSTFRIIDDVLSSVEAPKAPDFTRHELWPDAVDCVSAAIRASTAAGKATFSIGVHRYLRLTKESAVRRRVEGAAADLKALAAKTYTQEVDTSAGKRTRVRVGPFKTREEAQQAAAKLRAANLPASVVTL